MCLGLRAQARALTPSLPLALHGAQFGVLDYSFSAPAERIKGATVEKLRGNELFAAGKYEAAWKQYDKAFVHIYTSKEEWEAIGREGRDAINQFKLPCHLNRGLCRLRASDGLENALWDFSEALLIDPMSAKGHFRRGLVLTRLARREMDKEGTGEGWDMDKAEKWAADARADLMAAGTAVPSDKSIRDALGELTVVRDELRGHRQMYLKDQKRLYSSFISSLDRDNARLEEAEEEGLLADLPPLERVRIA
jgi:tetratricopeptide (TPR) repeat protein